MRTHHAPRTIRVNDSYTPTVLFFREQRQGGRDEACIGILNNFYKVILLDNCLIELETRNCPKLINKQDQVFLIVKLCKAKIILNV